MLPYPHGPFGTRLTLAHVGRPLCARFLAPDGVRVVGSPRRPDENRSQRGTNIWARKKSTRFIATSESLSGALWAGEGRSGCEFCPDIASRAPATAQSVRHSGIMSRRRASMTFEAKSKAREAAEMWKEFFLERTSIRQVRSACRQLNDEKFPLKPFKKTVVYAVGALTSGELSQAASEALAASAVAQSVFSSMCIILRTAIRKNIEEKEYSRDVKRMMPKAYAAVMISAFRNRREVLADALGESKEEQRLPSLAGMSWRVDVTISTTQLSRVFRPTVSMSLTLSDGTIRTFEVGVDKFNELRYNVAKVLKMSLDLEKHPMLARDL